MNNGQWKSHLRNFKESLCNNKNKNSQWKSQLQKHFKDSLRNTRYKNKQPNSEF